MPYKEKEIEKLYYSISEVAEMFKVNASLIRFWEKEFDILRPQKTKKGNRQFTPEDIENLRTIYHLVKEKGYTIPGAKENIQNNKAGVVKETEMIKSLTKIREFLVGIRKQLNENSSSDSVSG